jgi:hypothetical protein
MKRCLIILIVFCILFNRLCAQSSSVAIDSLVKYGIITIKERPALEKEVKIENGGGSYRVAVLAGLESMMVQKIFHIDTHKTGFMMSYSGSYPNKKKQDSINTSLHILLEKINKAGLLTDRVYSYTVNGIDSSNYVAELQLIGHLTEMSSRLEWLAPNKLLPVAALLHENDIVSDSAFMQMENDIKNGKIESVFQLNDYCRLDKVVSTAKYANDQVAGLEQFHRDISSMLPGLNFTHFTCTAVPDTDTTTGIPGGMAGTRLTISLVCNGRTYKHTSFELNLKNKEGKVVFSDLFSGIFFRIFNKILADEQSPLRLHSIMFPRADNDRNLALIALRGEQTRVLMKEPCLTYMMVSMESYDNTLTSARRDSAIAEWKRVGLFAHLSNAEISKAIDKAETDDLFSINNLLTNFPRVVYSLRSAMMIQDSLYINILKHIAEITHGAFNPSKITQRKVGSSVQLAYLSEGKIHSYQFRTDYGWVDAKFPAFLKRLSAEDNLPGNFYNLRCEDAIVYLTQQQHDYVVKHQLLDL